jgi:hypothetical protein
MPYKDPQKRREAANRRAANRTPEQREARRRQDQARRDTMSEEKRQARIMYRRWKRVHEWYLKAIAVRAAQIEKEKQSWTETPSSPPQNGPDSSS